jgi:single-strand DNA-binding protein|tara:strand:+ start:66 stop:524 length:459 start_codon:yes stop_codon:yes gene_type:complete
MFNQCQFIGNLGRDVEVRSFQNGNRVANLAIAVSEKWKDKNTGERKEKTEWINVSIFSEGLIRIAEQYLKKGSKVFISGKMQTRKWQDQSGADKYSTEIVLQGFDAKLVMLDSASSGQGGSQGGGYGGSGHQSGSNYQAPENSQNLDDEIPF